MTRCRRSAISRSAASPARRSSSPDGRDSRGAEVGVVGVEVEELGDEPAHGDDRLARAADVVECASNEDRTTAGATKRPDDLGVMEDQLIAVLAVVGDSHDAAVLDELVAGKVSVLADIHHGWSVPAEPRGKT